MEDWKVKLELGSEIEDDIAFIGRERYG